MKNKNILYLLIVLILMGGWFYWTQLRVSNIRKKCYIEAFRPNENNFEWAEGKIWTYLGAWVIDQNGWVYPEYLEVRANLLDGWSVGQEWNNAGMGGFVDRKVVIDKLIKNSMNKHKENRNSIYKQCLVKNGISTSL